MKILYLETCNESGITSNQVNHPIKVIQVIVKNTKEPQVSKSRTF